MSRSYKHQSGRIISRAGNGRFRRTTMADFGMGVCDKCGHITMRHYDGDESEPMIDPRLFRQRCFTCEPRTEEEQKAHDAAIAANKESNCAVSKELEKIINEYE